MVQLEKGIKGDNHIMAKEWAVLPSKMVEVVGNIEAALVLKALIDIKAEGSFDTKYISVGLDKLAESALLMIDGVYYGVESIVRYMEYLAANGLVDYRTCGNELAFSIKIDGVIDWLEI